MEAARRVMLDPTRAGLSESIRNEWVVTAEQNTTKEDVLDPQYWTHIASRFNPFDRIEVRVDDGSWLMELIVVACEKNWAKVHMLQFYQLAKVDLVNPSVKHIAEWKGPHRKFVVIRKADSQILRENFQSKDEAHMWIREHEKV